MTGVYQVTGAAQLRRTFRQAGEDLTDLKGVNKRVGDLVAGAAGPLTPVQSGRLLGSIRASAAASKVTIRAGGNKLRYAGPVHWGWQARNIRPHPFIADAATRTEDTWVAYYFTELQTIIDRVEGA